MHVAQVCPYSLSVPGGVQGQVLALARRLRRQGHDVTVLGPCDGPPPEPGIRPLGRSLPLVANGSVAPIAPDLSCALRTIAALRDGGFDVVHLHEPMVPGPTLTALLYTDRPVVGTFHRSGASAAYAAFGPLLHRWAARLDVRCAVSREAQATAEAAVGGPFRLLFNGVETEPFAKATPWPAAGPTVFFIGRHEPRKGLAVLLEAVSLIPGELRVWVAGEGPQTDELKARWSGDPRIEWLGRINDEEKAARMKGAGVVCAPSLHGESFGVVLLEAMAAGTPVVASDLPGYRNAARPDVDGLLVPPGDAGALAAALRRVMEDRALVDRLVAAGEARSAEMSMERLATIYSGIYTSLAAPRVARAGQRSVG